MYEIYKMWQWSVQQNWYKSKITYPTHLNNDGHILSELSLIIKPSHLLRIETYTHSINQIPYSKTEESRRDH